ncbi:hypothetical protein FACS1894153_3060 [Bacteroidia bacterium]|nr:hypothetical protein FACS1894153_3060 [Bacteroidia bacterium]
MFSRPVSAQTLTEYLYNTEVIGANPTLKNGNLTLKSFSKLLLGSHSPRGLQTNTLIMYGNYVGESGSMLYSSVVDNSNMSGTRGFLYINGTAIKTGNEGTRIELDFHDNWDGTCIDLVRANKNGSDVNAFIMDDTIYNGHVAQLKTRQNDTSLIWFVAEKIIIAQQMKEQSLCNNDPIGFKPLLVHTVSDNFTYQWHRCNADGSGAVNLGYANGAQTPSYTPPIDIQSGTYHYFCVVTSASCSDNSDTTAISEAISLHKSAEIQEHPKDLFICSSDSESVVLNVFVTGDVDSYQWYKNGEAITNSNTPNLRRTHFAGEFHEYHVKVNGFCNTVSSDIIRVSSGIDLIIQKMNNLLIVNDNANTNGGFNFTYYTWYKDGEKITASAHDNFGGHYYSGDNKDLDPFSEYWVEVITTEGEIYRSCPYTPVIKRLNFDVIAYPNPSSKRNSDIITVEAKGFEVESLNDGTISVYNMSGVLLDIVKIKGRNLTPIAMRYSEGVYILRFNTDVFQKEIKIIVKD